MVDKKSLYVNYLSTTKNTKYVKFKSTLQPSAVINSLGALINISNTERRSLLSNK